MIELSELRLEQFKGEGKLRVGTRPMFICLVIFFLAVALLCIDQSLELGLNLYNNILMLVIPVVLATAFGYFILRDGLFCFAADQNGWYFRNKGKAVLMFVPWADCHEVTQSTDEGSEIVFSINRNATVSELMPRNANVSIDGDILSIAYSGFIFFKAKRVRELNALRQAKLAKNQEA